MNFQLGSLTFVGREGSFYAAAVSPCLLVTKDRCFLKTEEYLIPFFKVRFFFFCTAVFF